MKWPGGALLRELLDDVWEPDAAKSFLAGDSADPGTGGRVACFCIRPGLRVDAIDPESERPDTPPGEVYYLWIRHTGTRPPEAVVRRSLSVARDPPLNLFG